jgi:hypothetical protein
LCPTLWVHFNFCGAFLSYLISNGISPALFEAGEKSKIVKFSTNLGDYKVYIKYSTICKLSDRKNARKWDIPFLKKKWIYSKTSRSEIENTSLSLFVLM